MFIGKMKSKVSRKLNTDYYMFMDSTDYYMHNRTCYMYISEDNTTETEYYTVNREIRVIAGGYNDTPIYNHCFKTKNSAISAISRLMKKNYHWVRFSINNHLFEFDHLNNIVKIDGVCPNKEYSEDDKYIYIRFDETYNTLNGLLYNLYHTIPELFKTNVIVK